MRKWFDARDLYIGTAVLAVLGPVLFMLDNQYVSMVSRQAQATPAVLEACTQIAAEARGPHVGNVKEACLMRFDSGYAQARYREMR